jgi:Pentapeptide repeats (8 copies)
MVISDGLMLAFGTVGLMAAACSGCRPTPTKTRRRDLRNVTLSGANLIEANAEEAYLANANLRSANLSLANLKQANFSGADLGYTELDGADLNGANLSKADLSGANLRSANLTQANSPSAKAELEVSHSGRAMAAHGARTGADRLRHRISSRSGKESGGRSCIYPWLTATFLRSSSL